LKAVTYRFSLSIESFPMYAAGHACGDHGNLCSVAMGGRAMIMVTLSGERWRLPMGDWFNAWFCDG